MRNLEGLFTRHAETFTALGRPSPSLPGRWQTTHQPSRRSRFGPVFSAEGTSSELSTSTRSDDEQHSVLFPRSPVSPDADPRRRHGASSLAYVGDAVWELFWRSEWLNQPLRTTSALQVSGVEVGKGRGEIGW